MMPTAGVLGAVLAGGAASRYGGRPKGLLEVGGRRIIDRVADALVAVTGAPPALVANDPDATTWLPGACVLPDIRPGCGTLGGIYTAVVAGADERPPRPVLCVAWDMPFVSPDLLRALVAQAARDGLEACLPASGGPRGVEPLCAVYGPACRGPIERRLDAGDWRAIAFHDAVRVGIVSVEQVRRFGNPAELFFNVNTPDDLERAEAMWRRRG